jgi:hypothetical protein
LTTSTWNPPYTPANSLHPEGIDRKVLDYFLDHSLWFQLVKRFQLPDSSELWIYQRTNF